MIVAIVTAIPLVAPGFADADCPVPGNYAVTVTGKLPASVHFTRLAMYSFNGDCSGNTGGGTVQEKFWYWPGDAPAHRVYGSVGRKIGDVLEPDPAYTGNADRNKAMQGMRRFSAGRSALTTLSGSWTRSGNAITISWANGSVENWRATWQDDVASPLLHKLELTGASYVEGATYLTAGGGRDASAANVGFAFGGPGPGFTFARTAADSIRSYSGLIRRNNAWCGAPASDDSVYETGLTLPVFHATTGGIYRYVYADSPYWVFVYFGAPKHNPKELARRVMIQTSHDWNGDGEIADEIGHTYSGLQVIDAAGDVRGFVFSDSSTAFDGCGENHTTSSFYYLDTWNCDALYGVDPTNSAEC